MPPPSNALPLIEEEKQGVVEELPPATPPPNTAAALPGEQRREDRCPHTSSDVEPRRGEEMRMRRASTEPPTPLPTTAESLRAAMPSCCSPCGGRCRHPNQLRRNIILHLYTNYIPVTYLPPLVLSLRAEAKSQAKLYILQKKAALVPSKAGRPPPHQRRLPLLYPVASCSSSGVASSVVSPPQAASPPQLASCLSSRWPIGGDHSAEVVRYAATSRKPEKLAERGRKTVKPVPPLRSATAYRKVDHRQRAPPSVSASETEKKPALPSPPPIAVERGEGGSLGSSSRCRKQRRLPPTVVMRRCSIRASSPSSFATIATPVLGDVTRVVNAGFRLKLWFRPFLILEAMASSEVCSDSW
nr:hypothetical protein Iba_chr14bCG9230 [Ipomoea batatas]